MTDAIESVWDFGKDEQAKARRWIAEIGMAEKVWGPYQKRCKKILARYENQRDESDKSRRFNIFFSNIETLKPATYSKTPSAVVLRRWNDQDRIAKIAAEVLERAVNFTQDCYDFDQVLKGCRDEFLLLAKGTGWVRYVPTFKPAPQSDSVDTGSADEDGQQAEPPQVVSYEEAPCDFVSYEDWGTNKCRNWSEVRFVYRKVYMDRAALKKRFTKEHKGTGKSIGEIIPLDRKPEEAGTDDGEMFSQATIYEIWDKPSRTAIWLSKSFNSALLDEREDPLKLKDFFPCPKPALDSSSPSSIIPIPDFVQYQDQCEELDSLTDRIDKLTDALVLAGVYAGDQKDTLENLLDPKNNGKIIPVDGWAAFAERGGLKGMIEYTPIEAVYNVLKGLYEAREVCKATIYELTGISDIMRGDTDADETATAQGIKSKFGSQRVREKQKEIARFARDIMRLQGELIANLFSIDTLKMMTNVKLLTQAEKQAVMQYQQAVQAMQAKQQADQQMGQPVQPQPVPPPPFPQEWLELMEHPTWEEIDQLLKSDAALHMRIDIEADSTVESDLVADKKDATEYMGAISGLLAGAVPVLQAFPPLALPLSSTIKAVNRKFNLGREVEEDWEKALQQISQMPPQQPEQAQTGKSPEELAIEKDKVQVAREKNQTTLQVAQIKATTEDQNSQRDAQTNMAQAQADLRWAESDSQKVAQDGQLKQMELMLQRLEMLLDGRAREKEADTEQRTRIYEADKDAEVRVHEADKAAEAAKAKKPANGSGA